MLVTYAKLCLSAVYTHTPQRFGKTPLASAGAQPAAAMREVASPAVAFPQL